MAAPSRAIRSLLSRIPPRERTSRPKSRVVGGTWLSRVPPRLAALALATVAAGLIALYLPVLTHAAGIWRDDEELSFGFLLPPIAAGLVWLRWSALRSSPSRGAGLALVALAGGLALYVAGMRAGVHAVAGASFLPTVLGAAAYLYGPAVARLLFAPAAFVAASLSLFRGLFASLGFALQELTARSSATLASLAGLPVRRSGLDLFVGNAHFVIAQACSGMDSLLALLSLSLLVVALAGASWLRRLLLLALVVPTVLVANVLRVTAVLALSQPFGTAIADGFPHQALSASVFLTASLTMWLACVVLRCLPRFDGTSSSAS